MALVYSPSQSKVREAFATLPQADLVISGKALAHIVNESAGTPEYPKYKAMLEEAREIYRMRFLCPVPAVAAAPATVADGTFTVVYADGHYVTIRLETVDTGKLAGSRIVSLLTGPDNERSFTGFGFLQDNGYVKIWQKHKGSKAMWAAASAMEVVSHSNDTGEYQEAYAMKSGRCSRCGRKLTVPASLHRGMGPECAAKS